MHYMGVEIVPGLFSLNLRNLLTHYRVISYSKLNSLERLTIRQSFFKEVKKAHYLTTFFQICGAFVSITLKLTLFGLDKKL